MSEHDIVERLRTFYRGGFDDPPAQLMSEAAAEIRQLRAEVERLTDERDRLEDLCMMSQEMGVPVNWSPEPEEPDMYRVSQFVEQIASADAQEPKE